ncbi:pyrophosphatase [Rhizobium tubonense]|uniref:Pyrophosphatase n=1 Tax=Rhizobium tubonense TaxID=484088 RepID=A0A2W4C6K8_9HYPH|nr:pyrophosphatase [Rhizobium tubonense]PZM09152.1 pyrophosphatase [Rhizobium tubonense]
MLRNLIGKFEAASADYATANDITRDPDWFLLKLQEELGELTQVSNRLTGRGRKKGLSNDHLRLSLADEAADVLGHILLFAHHHNLDLVAAVERKWRFGVDGI